MNIKQISHVLAINIVKKTIGWHHVARERISTQFNKSMAEHHSTNNKRKINLLALVGQKYYSICVGYTYQ